MSAALAGCAEDDDANVETAEAAVTQSFQSGIGGYTGTIDGQIQSRGGLNGSKDFTGTTALITRNTNPSYESEALVRFTSSSLPPGAVVTSATLTLTFRDLVAGHALRGYYVKNSWSLPMVGWRMRDWFALWNVPGAKGLGTDISSTAAFVDTTWTGQGNVRKTYPLDTATVQAWINSPSTNFGFVLVNNTVNNRALRVMTSEASTSANRPMLTISYTLPDAQAPTVSMTAPANGAAYDWNTAVTVTASASDNTGVAGVQFVVDGANLGAEDTTSPYQATYNTGTLDATHVLTARARDAAGNVTTAAAITITVSHPDTQAPTVAISAPADGATYDWSTAVTITANASDNTGVAGVQFMVDGADLGAEDTTPPYEATYGTGTLDATHVVTARARDAAGNVTTASPVTITVDHPDTQAPTVAITAPTDGAAYSWNTPLTITADASDNTGVAGVQFTADGADLGAEDTTPPYQASYNTGAVNAPHVISARARDAAGNVAAAVPVTITVFNPNAPAPHPRIWLDADSLQALRQKAANGDARWTALKSRCDGYLPGIIRPPDPVRCGDGCTGSTICCGFQGDLYYPALLNLALCYQVGKALSPPAANTTAWAQKAAAVLTQMVSFTNYGADHGYGVRNFATGLAVGYDWLYDYLAANEPALAATVVARVNAWIDWYDAQPSSVDFREHPTSNYFAGYYAAKSLTALATEGENPNASAYWTQFLALHRTAVGTHAGIAPYYTRFLDGGGWPQGWQYGPLSIRNMTEPSLAAMTAKRLDLITDASSPYRYARSNALHMMHFSSPSLTMMDDRDELASFNPTDPGRCPSNSKVPVTTALTLTEVLRRWPMQSVGGDPVAPRFHSFVRAARAIYTAEPWQDMLFWDDAAPEADYTAMPERSYLATNYVAMRSDWSTTATVATMRAIAYSDKDNTHEHPDGGSLIITRGNGGPRGTWATDVPFLVSPNFLMRCYGTMPMSSTWQESLRVDLLTSGGARSTTNGFRNSTTSGQSILIYQDAAIAPQSQIRTYEGRGAFVLARAENLDDLYPTTSGITEWSRDVVFIRPTIVLVYDRTTSGGATADPHLSWHFAPTPVLASPPSAGAVRYDVSDGAVFKGAITTLLPESPIVSTPENVFASNKLFGIQVRGPATTGSIRWLTVFDTATSSAAVAIASRIQTFNANGALLTSTGGSNKVVLFGLGAAGTPINGPIAYAQPNADTTLIITDLQPNTSYAVTATVNALTHDVTITQGASSFTTSSQGTLYVNIAADGTVTPGA